MQKIAFYAQNTDSLGKKYHNINIGFQEKRPSDVVYIHSGIVSACHRAMELWVVKRIHPGYRVVDFFAKNWEKSMKFGKNRRKLGNIAENWETSPKIMIIASTPCRVAALAVYLQELPLPLAVLNCDM
jgi:hypothetical protein